MKKIGFCLVGLIGILALSGCGKSMNVVEYNDSFVSYVKDCTDSTQALFDHYQTNDSTIDSILEYLQNSVSICQNSKSQALKLGDYDKDSSLKDAVVNLLSAEVEYLQKFGNTSQYWNIENITEEDKVAYDSLVNDLYLSEESLNAQFISLQEAQEAFAAKHSLKLE